MSKSSSRQPRKAAGRNQRQRHLRVRSELRASPDVAKIGNAVIALALAQAEKEAEEQRRLADEATGATESATGDDGTDLEQSDA